MSRVHSLVVTALVVLAAAVGLGQGQASSPLTPDALMGVELRSLGPSLYTGRIADIEVDPNRSNVYWVATAAGGLWKSENRGNTWTPVFDSGGAFNMCCVLVDPKNSNVIWLGTGENSNPRSSMIGAGLYKSTDAGATWARVGLEHSEHIGTLAIDPRNSDVVYVAVQGPLWSAGGDRGIYKTTDGGKTWKAILTVSADTGGNELHIDPNNPDVLYASTWQRRRGVGQMIGGGPESQVYKSTNGGNTWTKLTNGLPKVDMGRIAMGVDPKAKPTRVYALINSLGKNSGFYRSDDAGATWNRIGRNAPDTGRGGGGFAGRGANPTTPADPEGCAGRGGGDYYCGGDPGYYFELYVDPVRPDTVWSANTNLEWTRDGGKTWSAVPNLNGVHVDFHDVYADPKDKNHIIIGNDGGVYESWDDGKTWRHFTNLPITQFYRVSTDNAKPFYHVCGGSQDNGSMCGPSRTANRVGIRTSDWYNVGGGDGFQTRSDPDDPTIVYSSSQNGALQRLDLKSGVSKGIRPRGAGPGPEIEPMYLGQSRPSQSPGEDQEPAAPPAGGRGAGPGPQGGAGAQGAAAGRGRGERTNWDATYFISPHSSTRLYWGSQRVYRTDDRGDTWTPMSEDLTRALDPTKIPIMGKLWDPAETVAYNNATTTLSTIVSLDESPLLEGLLYVGTDDGNLNITEDGGKTWRKTTTFGSAGDGLYLTDVFASPRDANVVFLTLNNWQRGDYKPYVFRSDDRGRTFKSIAGDLPPSQPAWSIIQDHVDSDLIFLGTEWGLFVTVDGGTHWTQMKGGLPPAQIRDMAVQKRENDLVLGTFGRGFYVLDDYSALRELTPQALAQEAELFPLRNAVKFDEIDYAEAAWGNQTAPNPAYGAVFTYSVAPGFSGNLVLTITDDAGKQIRRLNNLNSSPGLHRVAWNLRGDVPGADAAGRGAGPAGGGGGGGGRGRAGGPPVDPGRFTATLGKMTGTDVTAIGKPRTFVVTAGQ